MPPNWLIDGLLRLGKALARISAAPPVPGIEPLLVENGEDPQTAHLMALFIVGLGKRWATERILIEKPLASELRRIMVIRRPGRASTRRASALQALLTRGEVEPIVVRVLDGAGLSLSGDTLREIAAAASAGDDEAWRRLVEISRIVLPKLRDPRGKPVSAATGIHLMLLHHLDGQRRCTWSDTQQDFTDSLTHATRDYLRDPDFDPRPACRLYERDLRAGTWQSMQEGADTPDPG